ncbi:MAG: PDZ domain-containing protein, partial [Parachlamydiaceae bacterium]
MGFLLFPLLVCANPSFTTYDDVNTIKNSFNVAYAMNDLKKETYNWEINEEIARIHCELEKVQTVKQAQKLLKRLFQSTKDYHCSIVFASTESASLPLKVKGVDSRYFITWIDRKKLSTWSFPYKEGDELTHFDNRPIDTVVKELIESDTPNANYETDKLFAENFLTFRVATMGMEVPKGIVTITVKPKNSSKSAKVNLQWDYRPELIKDVVRGFYPPKSGSKQESRFDKLKIMQKELAIPYASYLMGEDKE